MVCHPVHRNGGHRAMVVAKKGRPALSPAQRKTARIEMRCATCQREKLKRLGGAQWIRDQIDRAPEASKEQNRHGVDALTPCPHCGHGTAPKMTSSDELADDDQGLSSWVQGDSVAVICDAARPGGAGGCGAMGGFAPTQAEAARLWNRRTTTYCKEVDMDDYIAEIARLREALTAVSERIKLHPAYADLTEDEESATGGDTAELSYLARVADAGLGSAPAPKMADISDMARYAGRALDDYIDRAIDRMTMRDYFAAEATDCDVAAMREFVPTCKTAKDDSAEPAHWRAAARYMHADSMLIYRLDMESDASCA